MPVAGLRSTSNEPSRLHNVLKVFEEISMTAPMSNNISNVYKVILYCVHVSLMSRKVF